MRGPVPLPTLPSALVAFRGTHPYQFPWARSASATEQAAIQAAITAPGNAPPPAPNITIAQTLPSAPSDAGQAINVPAAIGAAQSIVDDLRYGEAQVIPFQFAAAGSQLVLPRPQAGKRTLLVIVSDFAVGTIRVNWDADATASLGVPITAGNNMLLDASVPQQNVFIFAPGAGQVTVCYINKKVPT